MRREQVPTVDGGTIEALVPETEADVEILRRRQEQGEQIDDRFSFGDYQVPRRTGGRRRSHRYDVSYGPVFPDLPSCEGSPSRR